jgi:hypothetical protein
MRRVRPVVLSGCSDLVGNANAACLAVGKQRHRHATDVSTGRTSGRSPTLVASPTLRTHGSANDTVAPRSSGAPNDDNVRGASSWYGTASKPTFLPGS